MYLLTYVWGLDGDFVTCVVCVTGGLFWFRLVWKLDALGGAYVSKAFLQVEYIRAGALIHQSVHADMQGFVRRADW
jgi:hypothetical protein